MDDVTLTLNRSEWRHPTAAEIIDRLRPNDTLHLLDSVSGLYSLPGLLLRSAGFSDALLANTFSPQDVVNPPHYGELPDHLQWMVIKPTPDSLWANSEVETLLHQWSTFGLFYKRQWQRLDIVEGAIIGTLHALGIAASWTGTREEASQLARDSVYLTMAA